MNGGNVHVYFYCPCENTWRCTNRVPLLLTGAWSQGAGAYAGVPSQSRWLHSTHPQCWYCRVSSRFVWPQVAYGLTRRGGASQEYIIRIQKHYYLGHREGRYPPLKRPLWLLLCVAGACRRYCCWQCGQYIMQTATQQLLCTIYPHSPFSRTTV